MTMTCRLALLLALAGPLAACATAPADPAPRAAVAAEPANDVVAELEIDPEATASGLFMAGSAAFNERRWSDAARLFDRAAEVADADDQGYLREQAFVAAVMGGDIEHAAQIAPTDPEAGAYRLGRLVTAVDLLARDQASQAAAMLGSESFGANYRAVAAALRPWAVLESGDKEAAIQSTSAASGSADPYVALNQAMVLEAAGQPGRAEGLYKALAGQLPEQGFFSAAYGAFLERQGRQKEAAAFYAERLKANPEDAEMQQGRARIAARRPAPPVPNGRAGAGQALFIAGMFALQQRDPESAVTYLRLSLRLEPDRADSLLVVGDFLEQVGDLEGARRVYARISPTEPAYPAAQVRVVMNYQKADDADGALKAAQRLAASSPREPAAQVILAEVLRSSKDYEGSIRILDKVIGGQKANADWSLYYSRAVAQHMKGDWPAAEKDLLKALAVAPEESDVLNYLGYSWADRGERLPEALVMIQKAADARPESGAVLDSLGWVYFRLGNYEKALASMEKAVELAPSAPDVNDHLGDIYAKVGRTLEARFQWQRVLTLDPDPDMKAKVEAKIASTPEPAPIVAASLVPETIETATP